MAHPENIILAMLGDEELSVRVEAVELVKEARQRCQPSAVRKFKLPEVNLAANNYRQVTDIHRYAQTADIEPPYVKGLTKEQLEACRQEPLKTGIPSHTQLTERAVKLATKAALTVSGADRQDEHALNKLAFRKRYHSQITRAFGH